MDQFTPGLKGLWTVEAQWAGDESHAPANSAFCRFEVEEKVEEAVEPPVFMDKYLLKNTSQTRDCH